MCDGNELMRETKLKYNTIQKQKDRLKRRIGESEKETGNGDQTEGKKRDESLRLAQGRFLQKTHTHAHKKRIHARPATHTTRSGGRSGSGEMSFTGGRSVEPSTQTGVELWPTNEGKKGDKSDDCWDTRMMAADVVACSAGRRDCGFSPPLSFVSPRE